uniref:NATURAL KILLER CELL PROTEASE 1 (Serine protease-inhibitor), protease substrate.2A n=1 Tax=Siphoviridae sp. ctHGG8 TaxID=2826230 RepID=A0A8S5N5B8_9CAUD|nr:MAG TPA: NATURAL KILLER CELL PROTEASE 1 (serine protease-inhibitor), protease substrate.2A [Siphoviridae sp. ctHGG8]DAK75938.1 MAG TPA: NATURAL KILLER CELL PROTEASE 1 (serine protease-inhibitor), protease substrate.2A [Caudoviricetes sp.]
MQLFSHNPPIVVYLYKNKQAKFRVCDKFEQ